ncbi:hypothetical protein K1T71_001211 [Dendrolimus kikuchii]|uniref:Uncharacterized protein n=1 Tax=Dendrolimus kikuchii TaxID=765133 RepID=A0ACC1DHE8_9NEOP|nr:hypothetical protein K1T71_001211 [Dendrolimus kikuchii]
MQWDFGFVKCSNINSDKMRTISISVFVVLVANVYSEPQFIMAKDDKLGVNFGGYQAAVGLGGFLGGGARGGLFAEAGTPTGQSARAGLGGAVGADGKSAGGLYAGATAGGNVKAEAGLAGGVAVDKTAGVGYATAQSGGHDASAGLGGETSVTGSTGFTYSKTKSFEVPTTVIKETKVSVAPAEIIKYNNINKEVAIDAVNEINPEVQLSNVGFEANAGVNVQTRVHTPVISKEVYVQPQTKVIEKHIVRSKPHRHHVHKTAFIGGYIGADTGVSASPETVIYRTVQPVLEKRVDVGTQATANIGAAVEAGAHGSGGGQVTYTKEVTIGRNSDFFHDIFNIPIATLKAVGNLLSNTAKNVSIQKTATVQAETDSVSPKHASSSYLTEGQISVQTPSASQIIDDIFTIPINTLGAVNKFLENNVPVRKRVQVSQTENEEPTRIRLGPHGRRRANKQIIYIQGSPENIEKSVE